MHDSDKENAFEIRLLVTVLIS